VTLPAPDDAEVESILGRVLRAARKDFASWRAGLKSDRKVALPVEVPSVAEESLSCPGSPRICELSACQHVHSGCERSQDVRLTLVVRAHEDGEVVEAQLVGLRDAAVPLDRNGCELHCAVYEGMMAQLWESPKRSGSAAGRAADRPLQPVVRPHSREPG